MSLVCTTVLRLNLQMYGDYSFIITRFIYFFLIKQLFIHTFFSALERTRDRHPKENLLSIDSEHQYLLLRMVFHQENFVPESSDLHLKGETHREN